MSLVLLIAFAGCGSIGVKEKHSVIYVRLGQHYAAFDELIHIATNEAIPVTVGDVAMELDVGGYIVVHEQDLQVFKKLLKEVE